MAKMRARATRDFCPPDNWFISRVSADFPVNDTYKTKQSKTKAKKHKDYDKEERQEKQRNETVGTKRKIITRASQRVWSNSTDQPTNQLAIWTPNGQLTDYRKVMTWMVYWRRLPLSPPSLTSTTNQLTLIEIPVNWSTMRGRWDRWDELEASSSSWKSEHNVRQYEQFLRTDSKKLSCWSKSIYSWHDMV